MTVQFVVSNSNVSSHKSIAQLNMTNTTFEAVNVIKEPQAFDDHCCTTTCKNLYTESMPSHVYIT
jgi:hypothetical protein